MESYVEDLWSELEFDERVGKVWFYERTNEIIAPRREGWVDVEGCYGEENGECIDVIA